MATEVEVRVEAQYPYSYFEADGTEITFDQGEQFILLKKTTEEWWKVQRIDTNHAKYKKKVVFVPAAYVKELDVNDKQAQISRVESPPGNDKPEYMNLKVFQQTMMRNNSTTDSDNSYSDQDTSGSLGTSPRVLNGSLSPSGMQQTLIDRKSMNLEAVLGEMFAKQTKRSDSVQSCASNEKDSTEEAQTAVKSQNDSKVTLREQSKQGAPVCRRSSTLPAGWQKLTDDSSGRQFYYNEVTKESVWKPPRMSVFMDGNQPSVKGPPAGYVIEKDESNEDIYVNSQNQEKWKSCKTESGQTYYYKIGDDVTAWELPDVEVRLRGERRRSLDDMSDDKLGSRMSSTFPRNAKCKSVLFDFSSSSLKKQIDIKLDKSPRPSPKIHHKRSQSENILLESSDSVTPSPQPPSPQPPTPANNTRVPEVEGYLMRKKLMEAGKSKKFHWEQVYVCKYDNILVFYKDKKSAAPKPAFPTGKPESSIDLHGATLDPPNSVRTKGKKNVFQISTYNQGLVVMLQAETPTAMSTWIMPIHSTTTSWADSNPLPKPAPLTLSQANSGAGENVGSILSPNGKHPPPITPTTPNFAMKEKSGISRGERSSNSVMRKASKRASTIDEDANKTKIKDKLKKFLPKRPTYYELEKKGIIKQEIFGCDLQVLCKREQRDVPKFVVDCIDTVERKGLRTRGIYRECGNASQMHKLRILTDQGEHVDMNDKQWADVHVIAGALKWYLRELPDPLIPCFAYNDFINAIKNPSIHERKRLFISLVGNLPKVNQATLKFILQHLLKVSEYSSENKMEKHNCSIVFGPTLMKPTDESDHLNIALNTVYQNQIVNFLLNEYSEICVSL